jgi:hypothetical protein
MKLVYDLLVYEPILQRAGQEEGIRETQEMMDFCAEHGIVADVEVIPIQKIDEASDRLLLRKEKAPVIPVLLRFAPAGSSVAVHRRLVSEPSYRDPERPIKAAPRSSDLKRP